MIMMQEIIHRTPLLHTWQALQAGKLTIGFLGGSITDGRPRNNWPESVATWFMQYAPEAKIIIENAAIGATGSDQAVFRAKRDIVDRGCNLVFVEYAVNDFYVERGRRFNTRESLLRTLLARGDCDVVVVYTFHQEHYKPMIEGRVPESIADFEQLTEHYQLGSVWAGLRGLNDVKKGLLRWEEWLPDGVHPSTVGSMSYANAVNAFLEAESVRYKSGEAPGASTALPALFHHESWLPIANVPLTEVATTGPWIIRRWLHHPWVDLSLETAAVGAKLAFSFYGRGLAIGFDYGTMSAEFMYRLDGGDWVASARHRPEWLPREGLLSLYILSDSLELGDHQIEIEVVHGNAPDCKGTNFRIGFIGIIGNGSV